MNYLQQNLSQKFVVGLSIKTSNATFYQDVRPVWERLHREQVLKLVPNYTRENILAVYYAYEGDYTQPFHYLVGYEVENLDEMNMNLTSIKIPSFSYAVFTATGDFPQSMLAVWQIIWNSSFKRAYTADFEVYPKDFHPFDKLETNPEIKVHIAVHKE
ncbi:MAG: hypothetical protein K0S74_800 [Chlamydiales bacterium]|jgi:predicted transcriptional regulator YdeE|nr:hypothetical protein [Chlamydiales bacterium]